MILNLKINIKSVTPNLYELIHLVCSTFSKEEEIVFSTKTIITSTGSEHRLFTNLDGDNAYAVIEEESAELISILNYAISLTNLELSMGIVEEEYFYFNFCPPSKLDKHERKENINI